MLDAYTAGRDNNFNLVRFIAASLVLYSHSYALTGLPESEPLTYFGLTLGKVAVYLFFFASGFLVTSSLFRSTHPGEFILARVLRIYPGLLVANLFAVFVIGLSYTTLAVSDYLAHPDIYDYLRRNTILFFSSTQYDLPGVFLDNPYPEAVNGSLWTLPREVKLYAQLTVIAALAFWLPRWLPPQRLRLLLAVIAIGCVAVSFVEQLIGPPDPSSKLLLTAFFFSGAAVYAWRDRIPLSHAGAAVAAGILALSVLVPQASLSLLLLSLGYLTLYLAYMPSGRLRGFNRVGDYSYGLYIYAFPVQQALAASMPGLTPLLMTAVALPLVLLLAMLSWHGVEQPMLALRGRRRRAGGVAASQSLVS